MGKSFYVTWEIDIEADDPRQAAEQAFACMRRLETTATVFCVTDCETGVTARIDLLESSERNEQGNELG